MFPSALPPNYSIREMGQIYAGIALGVLAPIAAIRYTIFHDVPDGIAGEAVAWTGAVLVSFGSGFGLNSTIAGGFIGAHEANKYTGKEQ
ncbi:MAG: hypothetical protein HY518_02165 [Candidatus Aenigmarchaeota archaeon]|nr:hypothetical protein [Candidatus Aenigmarchaeota archaeon]